MGKNRDRLMQPPGSLTEVIGDFPYRIQLAGGWIDQPFVSKLNPHPTGSMVVVSLEPTFRMMDRAGMATGSREIALKMWNGRLREMIRASWLRSCTKRRTAGKRSRPGRRI